MPGLARALAFNIGRGFADLGLYEAGLVFRPQRQWLRMGPDSICVLVVYVLGIAGLVFVSG